MLQNTDYSNFELNNGLLQWARIANPRYRGLLITNYKKNEK